MEINEIINEFKRLRGLNNLQGVTGLIPELAKHLDERLAMIEDRLDIIERELDEVARPNGVTPLPRVILEPPTTPPELPVALAHTTPLPEAEKPARHPLDHDGDGRPGGSLPGTRRRRKAAEPKVEETPEVAQETPPETPPEA